MCFFPTLKGQGHQNKGSHIGYEDKNPVNKTLAQDWHQINNKEDMIHGEALVQPISVPDCNYGLGKEMMPWAKELLILKAGRYKG